MQYWLIKSEPSELSVDDLAACSNQSIDWFGVRNYQARNFMRDVMQIGDLALFWHSSCKEPGIYAVVEVVSAAHPDSTQFEVANKYYDPRASVDKPIWFCVDVRLCYKTRYISIQELRKHPQLATLQVLQKGNRLSITPISLTQWEFIRTCSRSS